MKPHYRMTIIPKIVFWEISYIWALRTWGRDVAAVPGGYQHKFWKGSEILYHRIK